MIRGQPLTGPPRLNLALISLGLASSDAFTLTASPSWVALMMSRTCCSGNSSPADFELVESELAPVELEEPGLSHPMVMSSDTMRLRRVIRQTGFMRFLLVLKN